MAQAFNMTFVVHSCELQFFSETKVSEKQIPLAKYRTTTTTTRVIMKADPPHKHKSAQETHDTHQYGSVHISAHVPSSLIASETLAFPRVFAPSLYVRISLRIPNGPECRSLKNGADPVDAMKQKTVAVVLGGSVLVSSLYGSEGCRGDTAAGALLVVMRRTEGHTYTGARNVNSRRDLRSKSAVMVLGYVRGTLLEMAWDVTHRPVT